MKTILIFLAGCGCGAVVLAGALAAYLTSWGKNVWPG